MCDPFGDREIGLDYPQVCDQRLPMYDPFGVSHCLCASFLSLSCFRHRPPRRSDTSADALCCSQTPQRGDTLVTAGRRPADTATLPADSVPEGVALHYKTERPRYLTCPRITSGEVLIKSYVHLTLNSQELLVYRVAPQ